jgi:DNA-binding ferritin-like protein
MKDFIGFKKRLNEQEDVDIDVDPNELPVEGTDMEVDTVSTQVGGKKIRSLSNTSDLVRSLVQFQVQLRVFHWATQSFAQHEAAGKTYTAVDASIDAFVESYQGYYDRLTLKGQIDILNYDEINADSWLTGVMNDVNSLREETDKSDLQNILDEILASVSKFKYLLSLK